jgi:putative (di)nucleoside polyphosphate hydrolase
MAATQSGGTAPQNIADLPYRPCVGLMLLNQRGDVFVAQRVDQRGEAWQMPQGGIDPGEDPRSAAFRELHEEIGTDKAEILAESQHWHHYDLPAHLVPKVWGGKYRGQAQRWFALHFLGEDCDIDLDAHHPEFRAWCWVSLERLPDLIVPFKRDVYSKVMAEFRPVVARLRQRATG